MFKVLFHFSGYQLMGFPTIFTLGVLWNLGFLLLLFTVFQILTGAFLSLCFNVGEESSLFSSMFIIKEVSMGWLNSFLHILIPMCFFSLLYLHMFNGLIFPLYYSSVLWVSGLFLYVIFCIISFTGYCIVGGSMGYWALVVVSNLISYVLGEGFSNVILFEEITDLTYYKIFTYHYLFSMLSICFILVHIIFLHESGSSNGFVNVFVGVIEFSDVFLYKDLLLFDVVWFLLSIFNNSYLDLIISPDSWIPSSSWLVPEDISPEWFLMYFFVILNSLSDKSAGVIAMFLFILVLFSSPFLSGVLGEFFISESVSGFVLFYFFIVSCTYLSVFGGQLIVFKVLGVVSVLWLLDVNLVFLLLSLIETF